MTTGSVALRISNGRSVPGRGPCGASIAVECYGAAPSL
jgi:hypothetical protein